MLLNWGWVLHGYWDEVEESCWVSQETKDVNYGSWEQLNVLPNEEVADQFV